MLNANIIMFSRSLTKDYRWIYSSDCINANTERVILNDYKEFEKNKRGFLREKHLIIRQIHNDIVIYKFWETKEKDQNSRKIYALIGCVFSGFDFDIVYAMFRYVVSYLYEEFDVLFEEYRSNIPEKKENLIEMKNLSIDLIIEGVRRNNAIRLLANKVYKFIDQYASNEFILKNNFVDFIQWGNNNLLSNMEEKTSSKIYKNEDYKTANCQSQIINWNMKEMGEYKNDDFLSTKEINVISENKYVTNNKAQSEMSEFSTKKMESERDCHTTFHDSQFKQDFPMGKSSISNSSNTLDTNSQSGMVKDSIQNVNENKKIHNTAQSSDKLQKKAPIEKEEKKSKSFFGFFR